MILLVEDNPRTRESILAMLDGMDVKIEIAEDGLGGLNMARKRLYDMVLTDHKMPLMDGMALIRNLRDIDAYQDTPIVLMTTDDLQQVQDKAFRLGADRVLAKPLDAASLKQELLNLQPRDVA